MNRSSRFVALSALVIGLVGVTQPAVAQRLATSRLTSGPAIRKLLKPVLVETRKATVEVISEGETVALGTVVSEDGVIVTKASELGGTARCRFFDGEVRKAEIVTVDKQNDLALLKVDAEELRHRAEIDPSLGDSA